MNPEESNTTPPDGTPPSEVPAVSEAPVSTIPNPAPVPSEQPIAPETTEPAPQAVPASTPTPEVTNSEPTTPAAKRSRKPLLLGLLGVIVIAAAVIALVVVNKSDNSTAVVEKDIPIINVGQVEPSTAAVYPEDMNFAADSETNEQVFEGLTQQFERTHIVPDLATSWTNPDPNDWVFTLRHGVYFHDGTLMTSAIVKDSILDVENSDNYQEFNFSIASVTAPTPYTVDIKTTTPDALLANKLTQIYIYDTTSKLKNNMILGTGPYELKPGTKLTDTSAQLVAFNKYWGGAPHVKALDYTTYPTGAQLGSAYESGKTNVVEDDVPIPATYLGSNSSVDVLPDFGVYNITLNTVTPGPLDSLAVRKAVGEAIDRTALAKARGDNPTPIAQVVPQSVTGYDPAITVPVPDVTKAKTDLAAAGYPNGFTMSFMYLATNQPTAVEFQKEMAQIGVKVTLVPETQGSALGMNVEDGSVSSYYSDVGTSIIDGSDIIEGRMIPTFYNNDAVNNLVTQAGTIFDASKRNTVLQQAESTLMADEPVFSLYESPPDYLDSRNNISISSDNDSGTTGVFFRSVYEK